MTRLPAAGELLSIASSDAVFMAVFPVAEIASVLYVDIMMPAINVPPGIAVLIGGPLLVWITLVAAGGRSIDLWSARLRGRA